MFKFTFVDLENETSISIWEFEKMNVLKKYFCFSASQNAKNESQLKHKNQMRNRLFIDS